ncbi:hypothetical protein [Rufibacter sp. LB8]|uniref:hypothetical protein n=1 Tax=Rufibacter sp. LB8 TaxID=2777781 RepID=UPI00178C362A|nr:hypothetical protein [Rufibacter sp. LB8]
MIRNLGAISYTMKRQLLLLFSLATFLGIGSCTQDPEFPDVPSLTFREVEQSVITIPNQGIAESLILVLRFQDGNGDLGLSSDRSRFPQDFAGDFADNMAYHFNIVVKTYKKNTAGDFLPLVFQTVPVSYSGRFPRVSTEDREEPLEGDIRYTLNFVKATTGNFIKRGDVLRFEVFIYDRSKNKSNTVMSPDVTFTY